MAADPSSTAREVFRDAWLLVVDKPAGLPTQGTRAGEPGLYEALCASEPYVGLHHRLDRNASGLVLFTLDRAANAAIAEGFRTHTIQRGYVARVEGEVVAGTWSWPVDGKPARTDVEVRSWSDGVSEIGCRLHTGRKHQIRVHAAMNGTPILGDTRYGGDVARRAGRLALHAGSLELRHPVTGETLTLSAPTPW
ncbi:MAG: RluA family pseudouridine synthase [Myxococcota bacterium]